MTPFESLIKDLGIHMDVPLRPDHHQSCVLDFSGGVRVQIDLEGSGDAILFGSELGRLSPGTYRKAIFEQALRVNGQTAAPRGILAFSEKNDSLILYQIFPLRMLTGEKVFHAIQLFSEHARAWKEALDRGEIPLMEEDRTGPKNR